MREAAVGPGGARMRWVELVGEDPARVYVHGLGCSGPAHFAEAASHPALAGRRSLLVDLLGFGLSDRPAEFGYTLEDHADSLAATLDFAGVSGADVVGHSMGGAIAIVLAARRPDLVRTLVVVEGNLDPLPPGSSQINSRSIAQYTEEEFLAGGYERTLAAIDDGWLATMRLSDASALHRSSVGLIRGTTPTMRELLVKLDIPKTYIDGALSEPVPGRQGLIDAGVRYVVVPDAGHSVMIDNPGDFALAAAAGSA